MSVDPQYRLVAATLESEWNDKLRELDQEQQENENEYSYSISVKVRFREGMIKTLNVPGPKRVWQKQKTSEKIGEEQHD